MKRLRKDEYMTESTKQLEQELKDRIKEDRQRAKAERLVATIPDESRQYVLEILSRQLAAK